MPQKQERGFTLVETLVAITILAVAIAGPVSIAQQGLRGAILARDQLTASYLAQEGVEYIRAARDESYLAGSLSVPDDPAWDDNFAVCLNNYGCRIDMSNPTAAPVACNSGGCPYLNFNATTGFYGHQSGASWKATPFRRTIFVSPVGGSNTNYSVVSRVEWQSATVFRRIDLQDIITNWQSEI